MSQGPHSQRHHQIWGRPEVESSGSEGAGHTESSDRLREQAQVLQDKLKDVLLNSDSSEPISSSSGDRTAARISPENSRLLATGLFDAAARHGSTVFAWERTHQSQSVIQSTKEALLEQVLLDEEEGEDGEDQEEGPGTWSAGSKYHEYGHCKPCHYVSTRNGCSNGEQCGFCHLAHPKRFRPRPCKSKRSKCKRLAGLLDEVLATEPEQFDDVAQVLATQGGYLRTVVKSKLRTMHKQEVLWPGSSSSVGPNHAALQYTNELMERASLTLTSGSEQKSKSKTGLLSL